MQKTMTQDEVLAILGKTRQPATSLERPKRGDGSRYGKRHVSGEMNKTESEYSSILKNLAQACEIREFRFEEVTLILAKALRYTPDFMVVHHDLSITFIDTKGAGPISDTSLAKIKMAAKLHPWFAFEIQQKQKKSDGGGWARREF